MPPSPNDAVQTSIEVTCPQGHSFRVKSKYAGQRGKCPTCQSGVEVPASSQVTAGAQSPSQETIESLKDPEPPSSKGAGKRLGRFEILDVLGEGGFGTVYKAHDPQLDRVVALKVPRQDALGDFGDAQRFLREARAAANLRHPGIVPIFDAGESQGVYYIASAFIEGRTLRERIRQESQIDHGTAAQLVERLALALHYAHAQGVVHRDIKPDNILLDKAGVPHIADFGLARRHDGAALRTREGVRMGTPAYMSPEQHQGKSHLADGRSDLWALGVTLYEMLTGQRPFQGDQVQIAFTVLQSEPTAPRKLDASIPRDLETICLKCLVKDPDGRYSSCEELAQELMRWRRDEPIEARPVSPPERLWRWSKRNSTVATLVVAMAGLVLIGLLSLAASWTVANRHRLEAEQQREWSRRVEEQVRESEKEAAKMLREASRVKEIALRKAEQAEATAEEARTKLAEALLAAEQETKRVELASAESEKLRIEAEPTALELAATESTKLRIEAAAAQQAKVDNASVATIPTNNNIVRLLSLGGTVRAIVNRTEMPALPTTSDDQVSYVSVCRRDWSDADTHIIGKFPNVKVLVFWRTPLTGEQLTSLAELKKLTFLNVGYTKVTFADLACLSSLTNLTDLHLQGLPRGEESLATLKPFTQLKKLSVWKSEVNDADLAHLVNLSQLEYLNMGSTGISDAGLAHLAGMDSLRVINVHETQVTEEGIKRFKEACPKCRVDLVPE